MSDAAKARDTALADLVTNLGLTDAAFMAIRHKVHNALRAAEFPGMDSGVGEGFAVWHIPFGTVEYRITLEPCRSLEQKLPA